MADDEAILRTSLVPSMLRTLQWNANRGIRDVQLYEIGKAYRKGGESRSLIIAATGSFRTKSVHETEREFNFYDLKGDIADVLDTFAVKFHQDSSTLPDYYHPGRSARVGDVLLLGELHPDYAREYKLKSRVYIAEVDLQLLFESKMRGSIAPIPRFPPVRRDFSLLLKKSARYADVEKAVRSPGIPELVRIEPFDRLDSGPFPDSKYALAISLMYQSTERTLTDEEVETFDKRILNSLRDQLGAELRQ
jgi:phenylalanyl-tRNA synthetase beta chain